jgi:hypothetical protein
VLAGNDAGAARNVLDAAPLDLDAADDLKQPKAGPRIGAHEGEQKPARQEKGRQRHHHLNDEVRVEQRVEQKRAYEKGR